VAILVAAVFALTFSIVPLPKELRTIAIAAGGVLYVLWLVGYFVTFWPRRARPRATGCSASASRCRRGALRPRRALLRLVGLCSPRLPLFAGYLMILVTTAGVAAGPAGPHLSSSSSRAKSRPPPRAAAAGGP
jgi:hypothetical protein